MEREYGVFASTNIIEENIMNSFVVENAKRYIKNLFQEDFSGHDYYHSIRVYNLATHIAHFENANIILVQIIALLHDADDYKLALGNDNFKNTHYFLESQRIPASQIDIICQTIAEISYKGADTHTPQSIEGKIVQDADWLDAIGAIGIARTFAYGGTVKRPLHIPTISPKTDICYSDYQKYNGTSINHFYEKLLLLKEMLNTNEAKKIAEHRHNFMNDFLVEFMKEWECEC